KITTAQQKALRVTNVVNGTRGDKAFFDSAQRGLEGIMLSSAFSGAVVGALTQQWILGFIAGSVVAVLMALLLAFFHLQFNGDLILGGIALNILGSAGTIATGY